MRALTPLLAQPHRNAPRFPAPSPRGARPQGPGLVELLRHGPERLLKPHMPQSVERMAGPPLNPASLPLPLGEMKEALQDLLSSTQDAKDGLMRELEKGDAQHSLERLLVQRLLGGRFQETSFSLQYSHGDATYAGSSGTALTVMAAHATTLDIELEYQGEIQWQGRAWQVEGRLEIHLEQIEAEAVQVASQGDGALSARSASTIDTGRYLLHWHDAATFSIYDKFTRRSTTIWGDPHVDLSDQPGADNGEFSDLTKSSMVTVMELLDSTRVVILAPDNGAIQRIGVVKGSYYVEGAWGAFGEVTQGADALRRALEMNPYDLVKAGGDGNDWFLPDGELVWGGPAAAQGGGAP